LHPDAFLNPRSVIGEALSTGITGRLGILAFEFWLLLRLSREVATLAGAETVDEQEISSALPPSSRAFGRLHTTAMIVLSVGLVVGVLLVHDAGGQAVLFQLHGPSLSWLARVGKALGSVVSLSLQWHGYALCVGLIILALFAIHEECRHGNPASFAWVAGIWTVLLLALELVLGQFATTLAWPARPGAFFVVIFLAVLSAVLAVRVIQLWLQWWRHRKGTAAVSATTKSQRIESSVAGAFGRMGIVLTLFGLLLTVGAMIAVRPSQMPLGQDLSLGARRLYRGLAFQLEYARLMLENADVSSSAVFGLALMCFAGIALHYAAQFGIKPLQWILTGSWTLVALGSIFLLGRISKASHPTGWSAGTAMAVAGLLAFTLWTLGVVSEAWTALISSRSSPPTQ
jgi:hypothetical protein